ncbi:MAG: efflux RND transporter permease subunit, partial [Candidatus Saccharimonadales bacterium]
MPKTKSSKTNSNLNYLQKLSLWFFHRPRKTAIIWLLLAVFGISCYATLLKREGFPSINTPFAIVKGTYIVHDPAKVDKDVAKPFSDYVTKQDGVKNVQAQSYSDFYLIYVRYNENVDSKTRSKQIADAVKNNHILPSQATFDMSPYEFGFTERGDNLVVSFYSPNNQANTQDLVAKANDAAKFLNEKHLSLVKSVAIINPYEQAYNPLTGQSEAVQKKFDRYGKRIDNGSKFYNSVVIGIKSQPGADNIELDSQVRKAVDQLNQQTEFQKYHAEITASFAPQIKQQISELQRALLEGLLAVLIVGSIVIAIRASLITVISMLSVIAITNGLIYAIGYSLNTITLFALILGLSLIVDDTIIMVEALDAQRRRRKDPNEVVEVATGKVGRAMIAATSTAVLSFAPLIFVGGILGSFIRAIPITIISALIISLLVALIFIPLFARYILLRPKQMGEEVHEFSAGFEASVARIISAPMLWAKGSSKKLISVGLVALIIGLGFIMAGGFIFKNKVTFNIFPPDKDTDQLTTMVTFKPNTDINQAQHVADEVDKIVSDTADVNFVKASYYGQASIDTATLYIDLTHYNDRKITAPEIVKQLNSKFDKFQDAKVEAATSGVGPPPAAFVVQIESDQSRDNALKLANDVQHYFKYDAQLKRPDGTIAKIKDVSIGNTSVYTRKDGHGFVTVNVEFADNDTSTLFTLAQDDVKKEFPQNRVASYGLPKDALQFDTGQEEENQNSFKTLAIAFPILLGVIYLVLAFQFKSMLQPILIYTALPFSLFGITLGLWLTDNAFSFFAMLGFFALIGLSIKNTILLTDYANQQRKAGLGPVDAIHEALAERF